MRLALVACMAIYVAMCTGIGRADVTAGVCVLGYGAEANNLPVPTDPTFIGVNVGMNSETDVYDSQEDFETQCCAETGQPPDCFEPVSAPE